MRRELLILASPLLLAGAVRATTSFRIQHPTAHVDMSSPRCQTQALGIGNHPGAVTQRTVLGQYIRSITGWHGRLYFGYGDLNNNSGPIDLMSMNPADKSWQTHLSGLMTESIERFVPIGDQLWALNADSHDPKSQSDDYWTGNADHEWTAHEIGFDVIHAMDVTERVPGEIWLAGSSYYTPPGADRIITGYLWRSTNGGASWDVLFPRGRNIEEGAGPFASVGSVGNVLFATHGQSVWTWDGVADWWHARVASDQKTPILLGEFLRPVKLTNHLVFASFGNYLFKFDGRKTSPLGIRTLDNPSQIGFYETPQPIFAAVENRLLAVDDSGNVLVSTDLTTWTCIGKAPTDATGVGAMDGIVYFGGARGHLYAFAQKSW